MARLLLNVTGTFAHNVSACGISCQPDLHFTCYKDITSHFFLKSRFVTSIFCISSRGSGIRDQQRFHNRLQHARSPKDDSCIHIIACNIRSFSCSLTTDPCELLQFFEHKNAKDLCPLTSCPPFLGLFAGILCKWNVHAEYAQDRVLPLPPNTFPDESSAKYLIASLRFFFFGSSISKIGGLHDFKLHPQRFSSLTAA